MEVADDLGLKKRDPEHPYWCRHPLAFLVEAADDICYRIIDIEDGYELGYLNFAEAKDILASIACDDPKLTKLPAEEADQIGKLRAVAVGLMVDECVRIFVENKAEILAGCFSVPLIECTKYKKQMTNAFEVAKEKLYQSGITTREMLGATVITGLLDIFAEVVVELMTKADFDISKLNERNTRLARLMGEKALKRVNNTQEAVLCLTDFVSGMTDRFAVETYRTLMGISTVLAMD
jgi:dGTPase